MESNRTLPGRPPGTIGFLLRYLYIGCLLTITTLAGLTLGYGWPWLRDTIDGLPLDDISNYRPVLGSQLLAADGSPVAEFFKETKRQQLARYEDLPKHLVDALVATEDQQFYKHNGVNPIRIAKAFLVNLAAGAIKQGGSTITQQIAKNIKTGDDQSYYRKFWEALYAFKIEQQLSKEEILTIYFNQVPFGHNWEGIWTASEGYFGKTPKDLDLAESATLVGVLKGNNDYSPIMDPGKSLSRRKTVLNAMYECGYITQEERDKAAVEELVLVSKRGGRRQSVNRYPYWRAYFQELLFRSRGATEKVLPTNDRIQEISEEQIYKGGLKIHSTLDPTLQGWAEEELQKALTNIEKERRKNPPGWGLMKDDWPRFPSRLYPNAILLGKIAGVVKEEWLTVQIEGVPGKPVVAVRYPDSKDWRIRFGVLLPGYYVQINSLERAVGGDGSLLYPEQELVDRGLATRQKFSFQLIDADRDQHAQGALVCLEVGTGRVLTWVGGYDWDEEPNGRQRIRCIEGHQPGSSFKPVIFADAFERGYTPSTRVSDAPFYKLQPNGVLWAPMDYDKKKGGGEFPIRKVLAKSLNKATVRVFDTFFGQAYENDPLTQQTTLAMARRLGIHSPIPQVLSTALGTGDVTPLEMATAYSVFANSGVLVEPYTIDRIEKRDAGQRIYSNLPSGNPQALDPVITFMMTDILTEVLRESWGTGYKFAHDFPYPIAGKTGTTDFYNDVSFVGYSKTLVTALWIGHDRRTTLGSDMAGGKLTLPPWLAFMKKAIPYHLKQYKGWSDADIASASGDALNPKHKLAFEVPGQGLKRVRVCSVSLQRPNTRCLHPYWIWVKEGEEPRDLCMDCVEFYTDLVTGQKVITPPVASSEEEGSTPSTEAAVPRPVSSNLFHSSPPLEPEVEPVPEPGVEIRSGERGWVPEGEDYQEEPPLLR